MGMATATPSAERRTRRVWEFGADKSLGIPPEAHTFQGFLDWVMADDFPEKLRVTFDDGWVGIDMCEEAIETHAKVKIGIFRTLIPVTEEEDFGELFLDGVLICNEEAAVSNNPDGLAARWESFESGRVRYVVRDGQNRALEGTPDWVMEIISNSSVAKDTKRLRAAYHRAKIPEYWLIDAREKEIDFQILSWRKSGYAAVPSKDGWTVSKVFGRSFRLTRKKDRLGGWKYTLEVRTDTK